jgi:peptide/nickel transport system substrate-binding protein
MRPEAANPRSILDPNVHRAVAHAIDKQALADALYEGQGTGADVFAPKRTPWFTAMDQAATKYPYDPKQSQAAMEAVGFTKGADGFYIRPGEAAFSPEWRATEGGDSGVQVGVLSDALRRVGIDAHPFLLRRPFEMETRASFPALMNWSTTGQPEDWLLEYTTGKMATAENRWNGTNFGGWSNLDYDRLAQQLAGSLDQSERADLMVKMAKLISDELPVVPLYYSLDVIAHVAALRGVEPSPDGAIGWNVEKWELA